MARDARLSRRGRHRHVHDGVVRARSERAGRARRCRHLVEGRRRSDPLALQGYADITGSTEDNMVLSDNRAEVGEELPESRRGSIRLPVAKARGEEMDHLPANGRAVTFLACTPPLAPRRGREAGGFPPPGGGSDAGPGGRGRAAFVPAGRLALRLGVHGGRRLPGLHEVRHEGSHERRRRLGRAHRRRDALVHRLRGGLRGLGRVHPGGQVWRSISRRWSRTVSRALFASTFPS